MYVRVLGLPQPQGSKRAFVVKGRAIVSDANDKNLKPWRGHVTQTVGEQWGEAPLLLGPVKLGVVFAFPRPASHYGSGKNVGVLRGNAPEYKTSAPDLDKLQRAIGDALTGTVFRDDSQIVVWEVSKRYAEKAFCDISITDLQVLEHISPSGGRSNDTGRTACACEGPRARATDSCCRHRPHQGV